MRMHQVEVDDEVFAFVKSHAEPLVDSFSSALRRLLPLKEPDAQNRVPIRQNAAPRDGESIIPSLPRGIPQALRQILEVTHLVRSGAYTRRDATRFVAKQHGVFQQTVSDKYGRQLELTANQFDRLLDQDSLVDLKRKLSAKFPSYTNAIEDALS